MKIVALLLSLAFTTATTLFDDSGISVTKKASDKQIQKIEKQLLEEYGVKVKITVLSRNRRKEITNLTAVRYDKNGNQSSSCSSDKFGLLIITKTGCKIADAGYEGELKD
nr:hypothetical protein [uncultured Arsenicibacter sp.]